MKLARLGPIGAERPVVVTDDRTLDATPVTADYDAAFFAGGGVDRLTRAVADGSLPVVDPRIGDSAGAGADDAAAGRSRVGAPVARPSAIYCIGMNYAAHAAESGSAPPEVPVLFMKPPNTLVGPDDDVTIPRGSVKTDWEVELAVVISERASYLSGPEKSLDHVAGFAVANDLSERDFQLTVSGGQWSKGKAAAGFTPLGPWLVTPDEVDHHDLRLRSWVNGEPRQDSSTADLIFDVEYVIWHLSQYLVLEPGDVILTGTPEGVALSGRFPYLGAGDTVELQIDGLGRQRQTYLAHPDDASA